MLKYLAQLPSLVAGVVWIVKNRKSLEALSGDIQVLKQQVRDLENQGDREEHLTWELEYLRQRYEPDDD